MLKCKFVAVKKLSPCMLFMAGFLLLLQIATAYGGGANTNLLPPSSASTGSSDPPDPLSSSQCCAPVFLAPISTSENNVYVSWSSNKTGGNYEVMFRASTDNGETFASKINLSNSPGVDSLDPSIAASGNNVYVSWWERANQTSNEPVIRVSNDNGKTFGPVLKLAANGIIGSGQEG
ncbi:MAG: hypothetical protein ACJ705_07670 [Nitrososphaeraceae archaeon]|jgi:hypothetical protein